MRMVLLLLAGLGLLVGGCSFDSQPKHKAELCIQSKKHAETRVIASLNEMVKNDSIRKSLTMGEIEAAPSFAATYNNKDHYRITCRDNNETTLIDVHFDGKTEVVVHDTLEYAILIKPPAEK